MLTTVHRNQRGFTLVEVTIILLVLVILSMIMLPQLGQFNRLARKVKAFEDIGAICAMLKMFVDDVGIVFFEEPSNASGPGSKTATAAAQIDATGGRVGLLVGPGATPSLATDVDTPGENNTAAGTWATDLATDLEVATDIGTPQTLHHDVDLFSKHLIQNAPTDGNGLTNATGRYPNQVDDSSIGFFSGWHGPYMNEFTPDPWQQRYAANVFGLHTGTNGSTYSTAVVCISSGPNARIETILNQPMGNPPGWVTGGDDIAAILSSFGPF